MGVSNPEKLYREIPNQVLNGWIAYSQIERFGEDLDNYRTAILTSVIYNMWRGKDNPPKSPKDILDAFFGEVSPQRKQSPDHMLHIVEQLNTMMGGQDKRKKRIEA